MARLAGAIGAFALAAVCFAFVAIDRWWPCAAFGVGSEACGLRQDDSYDIGLALGGPLATQYAVRLAAYVLVGVGLVLVGRAAGTTRARRSGLVAALLPWLSAVTMLGPGVEVPGATWWLIVATVAVGPLALAAARPLTTRAGLAEVFAIAMVTTSLLIDFFALAPLLTGYFSWDTNPWTWLPSAIGCTAASVALAAMTRGTAGGASTHGRPRRSTAATTKATS